ncbi:MAG: NAD(P)H-dependent oxidoreductase subunit E [Christensenellaceae bacterium]|nr:NAD(P)H-dependent oxidoreductase subunit E [Christensenellaceae bacterium]MDD6927591.1 NAD(P)H-dependent oxidoreductase subunit E [bacterium]
MTKHVRVPFNGTKEQEEKLNKILKSLKNVPGALMPALQQAQEIYGYLPMEVQETIADKLGLSLAEVYGVATFYSQFTLVPKGKVQIGVCLGTACYVKGSGDVYAELQKLLGVESGITEDLIYSLDATRCIGCCGLAPVMTINGDVYGKITKDQVAGLLAKYKE